MGKTRKVSSISNIRRLVLVGNAKKYSLGFQLTEVSRVRKVRKASRISSVKRLVWWDRQEK